MKHLNDTFKMHNGVEIPCVGFGTWQTPNGEVACSSVKEAIKVGYRHIDTAAMYQNEESVGKAIKESGIPRNEFFVTSKLQTTMHGYEDTLKAFDETMKKLDMEYLDLYLIHWPNPIKYRENWEETNAGTWKAFEELYEAGRVRAIGISNFNIHHIEALMKNAKIKPMVNQIYLCPGITQPELVDYCNEKGIILEAYSPLGTGTILKSPEMKSLAEKYNKTVAQVALRWSLQKGFLPLPKSVTPERIKQNTELFDFELSKEDVELISKLEGYSDPIYNPDTATF